MNKQNDNNDGILQRSLTEALGPKSLRDDEIERLLDVESPETVDAGQLSRIFQGTRMLIEQSSSAVGGRFTPARRPAGSASEITMKQISGGGQRSARNRNPRGAVAALAVSAMSLLAVLFWTSEESVRQEAVVAEQKAQRQQRISSIRRHWLTAKAVPDVEVRRVAVGDTVETGHRERRRVHLPDGSVLYVNELATVKVATARRIEVQRGEVFVEVVPQFDDDNQRELFTVVTSTWTVTALGTKFGVDTSAGNTDVLVTQGKVRVSGITDVIESGQRLETKGGDSNRQLADVAHPAIRASEHLSWTRELMVAASGALVPTSDYAGGAIITVDPSGQETKLSLRKYHVDVHIEDGFARTTIDQTYFNHTSSRLEGTFHFPLPPDASLSRLAMYVNGKLMEGGMAEREHARNTFEKIVHKMKDPALLEWVDGSTFKMRVFPLEARQEKRIVLSYTQRLNAAYGKTCYRFPAGHSMDVVRDWSTSVRVRNGAETTWQSPSHELSEKTDGGDLYLTAEEHNSTMDRDLVVELGQANPNRQLAVDATPRWSRTTHEDHQYLMLRFGPDLPDKMKRLPRHWVFLFESSADRNPLLARTQIEIIRTLLDNAEHSDTFNIVTANTEATAFSRKPLMCSAKNIANALADLNQTHLIGAMDLQKALTGCAELCDSEYETVVVHTGSGIPVLGEQDQSALLKLIPENAGYVGVGVGKRWSRPFMKAAASKSGGYFTQINPDEDIAWRAFELSSLLNTPRLLNVDVTTPNRQLAVDDSGTFLNFADTIVQGEEICAVARFPVGERLPKTVLVSGLLNGQPWKQTIKVKRVADEAEHLPRSWARLQIDRLLADNAAEHRSEIIRLSKSMYVMSPFTSLLVLENEEMYTQHNIDRGRKDHWALYACPDEIKVVHEPLTAPSLQLTDNVVNKVNGTWWQSVRFLQRPKLVSWPNETIVVQVQDGSQVYSIPVTTYGRRPDGNRGRMLSRQSGGWSYRTAAPWFAQNIPTDLSAAVDETNRLMLFGDRAAEYILLSDAVAPEDGFRDLRGDVIVEELQDLEALIIKGNKADVEAVQTIVERLEHEKLVAGFQQSAAAATPSRFFGSFYGWDVPLTNFSSSVDGLAGSDNVSLSTRLAFPGGGPVRFNTSELSSRRRLIEQSLGRIGGQTVLNRESLLRELNRSRGKDFDVDLGDFEAAYRLDGEIRGTRLPVIIPSFTGKPLEELSNVSPMTVHDIEFRQGSFAPENYFLGFGGNDDFSGRLPMYRITSPEEGRGIDLNLTWRLNNIEESVRPPGNLPQQNWAFYSDVMEGEELTNSLFNTDSKPLGLWTGAERGRHLWESRFDDSSIQNSGFLSGNRGIEAALSDFDALATMDLSWGRPALELSARTEKGFAAGTGARGGEVGATRVHRWRRKAVSRNAQPFVELPSYGYVVQPQFGNDGRYFGDLITHAPGLNTSQADVLALAEKEVERKTENGSPGVIDEAARTLIERAGSRGWERVTFPATAGKEAFSLLCDGAGRHVYSRVVSEGLREDVSCDGEILKHVYADIGLASERKFSRFHRRTIESLVPWLLPSVEELARGADVLAVDDRTVAVVPKLEAAADSSAAKLPAKESDRPKAAVFESHFVFGDDGRLVERRLVVSESQKVLLRTVFENNGTIRLLNGGDKELSVVHLQRVTVEAPNLKTDDSPLVVLPMPIRSSGVLLKGRTDDDGKADFSKWSKKDLLSLILADLAEGNGTRLAKTINDQFFRKDDRRDGLYVLLSRFPKQLTWEEDVEGSDGRRRQVDLRPSPEGSPLRQFVRQYISWQLNSDGATEFAIEGPSDGFVQRMATARNLYHRWKSGQATKDRTASQIEAELKTALAFIDLCRTDAMGWTLLSVVQPQIEAAELNTLLAEAASKFEHNPQLAVLARQERVRALFKAGKHEKARKLYSELLRATIRGAAMRGRSLPRIATDVREHFISNDGATSWAELVRECGSALTKAGMYRTAFLFSVQLRQLGDHDEANQLLETVLADITADNRPDVALLAVEQLRQLADGKADQLMDSLLHLEELQNSARLWRYAAKVADDLGHQQTALRRLERAILLEFDNRPDVINVERLRADYTGLLTRFENVIDAAATLETDIPDDLFARIIRAADQWRSLEDDPTACCHITARLLSKLHRRDLAWSYLTTPLAERSGESAPWRTLAETLTQQKQVELADVAWSKAFEFEQTNPEILLGHAKMLQASDRSAESRRMLKRIVDSNWQPRFNRIQQEARNLLR